MTMEFDNIIHANLNVHHPPNMAAISLASVDYVNTAGTYGFKVFVGVSGDVKVDGFKSGSGVTFTAAPAGYCLPGLFSKVYKVGTDATNLTAVWYNEDTDT